MHYKRVLAATIILLASSAAHANYYNSYGAQVESLGSFDQTDSCGLVAETTVSVMAGYLANAPDRKTLENQELEESLQQSKNNHELINDDQTLVKAYSYDLDQFSSPEEFKEQFYQDCLEES